LAAPRFAHLSPGGATHPRFSGEQALVRGRGRQGRRRRLARSSGFGALALMAAYDRSRSGDTPDKARAATLGATYALGATTLKAGYGRQRLNDDTHHFASLGADYALSKRTTVYASLGHQRYAHQPSRSAFGVGMAHAF